MDTSIAKIEGIGSSQSGPQSALGKSYYTVFPKNDADTFKTIDFIKQIEIPAEEYLVFAKDGKNQVESNQTEQLLKSLVGEQNIWPPLIFDDEIRYWLCTMTISQRDDAAKYPGVKAIERNMKGELGCHVPPHDAPVPLLQVAKFPNMKDKRAIGYYTQKDTATKLVRVGQPSTISNIKNLKNYVYESNSGKNSFEFPNVVPDDQHLQTDQAKHKGIHPWEDPIVDSHGTCTAGKAVGNNCGAAKQAKLVVVKIWNIDISELNRALSLIIQDIKTGPERRKKSVVRSQITCILREGNVLATDKQGTSFTAAVVAGEAANLPSYDTVPFDTSDGNLLKNMRNYQRTDAAGWARTPNICMIWNEVTEKDNPKMGTSGLASALPTVLPRALAPEKKCHSLTNKNPNNPANYKGGGLFTDRSYKYHIDPQTPRQPASSGKKGGCDSRYKLLYNEYPLWGHGWDSADYGKALQKEVKGCALLPDAWSFSYGMGSNGREWTAKLRTGVFQKKFPGHAGKTTSRIDNFGCSGPG
ncbi:hypothetical protein BGZ60DRAFT_437001 [Tricladium varicosporioides]|nr:hypothetical protein BGZ60DRAFT_437001 [Hymenoscyphus varicosporioides]